MGEADPHPGRDVPGGQPRLKRVLTRGDLILFGLVILTPTAPYPVFGLVQQNSQGHAALSYLVAMAAMLFTAASYGKMASAFPAAGSTYTFTQKALNEHLGFLAGWAMILDYFLIPLLSVIYVALTLQRILPEVPYLHWKIPYFFWVLSSTGAITAINLRGIRVTNGANLVMMAIMSVCAVLFVWLAARWVVSAHGWAGLFSPAAIFQPRTFAVQPLMLGAGIATLSYLGFDAISTLAEDTVRPERDIAFATVLVCVVQTVICLATVYLAALVWPDYRSFPNADTIILDIGRKVGGEWFLGFITLVLVVAGWASALTGQAGASRLLYGMGRDGVISRRIFGYLDPRHATPTRGIYLMGAVSLLGAAWFDFQGVTELTNFGAFVGFILVNLSVIRHYYFRLGRRRGAGFWTNLVFPLLGALVCVYVWRNLNPRTLHVGGAWMGAGIIYLAVVTRGFRLKPKSLGSLNEGASETI
jgi:amino acid transporter